METIAYFDPCPGTTQINVSFIQEQKLVGFLQVKDRSTKDILEIQEFLGYEITTVILPYIHRTEEIKRLSRPPLISALYVDETFVDIMRERYRSLKIGDTVVFPQYGKDY